MGKKVAAREFLNDVVFVGVLYILAIIFVVIFSLFFIGSQRDFPGVPIQVILYFIIATVVFWTLIATWLQRKKQSDSIFLDLGRSKSHKMYLVSVGCFTLFGILSIVFTLLDSEDGFVDSRIQGVSISLFWLSLGAYSLFRGLSHFEFSEGGIFYKGGFVKWERIKSYEWEGENSLTLTLRIKRRLPFFRTRSLPIPAIHKDKVENLLARYL